MRSVRGRTLLRHIHQLAGVQGLAATSDGELVRRFAAQCDGAAFEALLVRHGPMVLSVCRRVLHHLQDAEDAFQATFLVLARKAGSLQRQASVGNWLYGVARRVALGARAAAARRSIHEKRARTGTVADPLAEISLREGQAVLDAEVSRLPDKYRAPLVLCCLEGMTRDEAARQLGYAVNTVKNRLERGRQLLRARLTRRGLTLSAALAASLLGEGLAQADLPAALARSALQAATVHGGNAAAGAASLPHAVFALAEGTLRAMAWTKLNLCAALLLALGLLATGAGLLARIAAAPKSPPSEPSAQAGVSEKAIRFPKERCSAWGPSGSATPAGCMPSPCRRMEN